jgi:gliding motility-associated lipoprotein GldD
MRFTVTILLLSFLFSCRPETYTPKPRGYFNVVLPEHGYKVFDEAGFPYSFEYPRYGNITKDTVFMGHKPENPYWIYIDFPTIGGRFYISYKQISASQPLSKLMEDSHEMSFTVHSKRANYINEQAFTDSNGYRVLYNAGGNAASAYQFIATDSSKHFLRGALYFDVTPNADSLMPANEFLKEDMKHLLETLHWR